MTTKGAYSMVLDTTVVNRVKEVKVVIVNKTSVQETKAKHAYE